MQGYDPKFLDTPFELPLPKFKPGLVADVLSRPDLRDSVYADYIYYTVAMHREFRTPLFAALNIDRTRRKQTDRGDVWTIDSRVGDEHQLNNDYYVRNDWDRGHLAMRAATAWGDTGRQAQKAADETFYYTNATLQHANFNQDEWLALESWVLDFQDARDGRVSEFSGPIFGDYMRTVRPTSRPVAYVPVAFYKVIAFVNLDGAFEVRAFLIYQDEKALADKNGKRLFDNQIYQVSVAEVERLTGLEFADELATANPIWFRDSAAARRVENVTIFPERRDVNGPQDIMRAETQPRPNDYKEDNVPIFIAGALVDPVGDERTGEWVSLLNLSAATISIEGWTLLDKERRVCRLTGEIGPGEAVRIHPLGDMRLVNSPSDDEPGLIILNDAAGDQIDRVSYRRKDLPGEGRVLSFAYTQIE